jgi:DNA-binding XRE family transcriptional regulator
MEDCKHDWSDDYEYRIQTSPVLGGCPSEPVEIICAMAARSAQHAALGDAVRELRMRAEISQETLARRSGMHRTYIGGIERGERNVSFANLVRLAAALDERPSKLLERCEELWR